MTNISTKEIVKPKNKYELVDLIKKEMTIHGIVCDLNHIDISLLNNLDFLFSLENNYQLQNFNGNISKWNTSFINSMYSTFEDSKFNGDISKWDTSNVTHMNKMFQNSKFNGDISKWNTKKVMYMREMFSGSIFTNDISQWNVSSVIDMASMFSYSLFSLDLSSWNLNENCYIYGMFYNSKITKIPQWNYFSFDFVSEIFDDCENLVESLPEWYQFNDISGKTKRMDAFLKYLNKKELNNKIIKNNSIIKQPTSKI